MNYMKIYNDLVQHAKLKNLQRKDQYIERHHIIMKSLGGLDNDENLVAFTARQHYIAHLLLFKHYKQEMLNGKDKTPYYKCLGALSAMIQLPATKDENGAAKRVFKFGSHLYNSWKIELSKKLSITTKGENAPNFGKIAYYSKELDQVRYFLSSDVIPDGYILGNPKSGGTRTKDTHWYYNKQTLEETCLTDEEYELVDKTIWIRGQSPNRKQFIRYNPAKDAKCMYNETLRQTKHVKPSEIENYLKNGWKLGAVYNWERFFLEKNAVNQNGISSKEEQRKQFSLQQKLQRKYEREKQFNEKRKNDIEIYSKMYEYYIANGWELTKEKFNYQYSYPNFCQRCKVLLKSFIPQNGKKRKQ